MESVEPAGGSTVSTATARNAAAMTGRTGGLAPRATATRPAITPAQPSTIAPQSDTVTNVAPRCRACHHGRPPARRRAGTETLGPAAEITIMTSVEATMATTANQPVSRVSSADPGRLAWVAVVPSTPSMSLTKSPVYLVTVVMAVPAHP